MDSRGASIDMYIHYVPTEYRGLIESDPVLPITRIKFVPLARYEIIKQAFYNINYFRR